MKNLFLVLFIGLIWSSCSACDDRLDISGEWTVRLDTADVGVLECWYGMLYENKINLPGTTDDAGLGVKNTLKPALEKPQLLHLTRKYSHIGPAWYSREIEIPSDMDGKDYILNLERVMWNSRVWVDGKEVRGQEESLTTPHKYDLTPYLKSGNKHILTIRVDNRKRYDISVKELAHAYTEDTQVKWNGILGEMYIEGADKVRIDNVQLYPDAGTSSVKAVVTVVNSLDRAEKVSLAMDVENAKGNPDTAKKETGNKSVVVKPGISELEIVCNLGDKAALWSELAPNLYEVTVTLDGAGFKSDITETFGLRQLSNEGNRLMLNGYPIFLRGTLECCIFPLTGYPPTDKESWRKLFSSAREYGLNHLRFHSWCPPEAAFNVADEMGFYLQIELPVWSVTLGDDPATIDFLRTEAKRISKEYGTHPSFCFWSLGNELQHDFDVMGEMLKEMKETDKRHLYTTTSFTFEKGHGIWPEQNDDFFVTQWTNNGWVRGQGVFNSELPSFNKDFRKAIEGMQVPLVTHEVGQYSVYPDINEIPQYMGNLIPLNFMAVKEDLEKKGLLGKADDYLMASGKLAYILYKEEIERALKTPGNSGFQLLDLHDFPGQGTALVGLLNAFWGSKGITTGVQFREFCSPVVPLLRFSKAAYLNDEIFTADVELCNYSEKELEDKFLKWQITSAGKVLAQDSIETKRLAIGHNENIGHIEFSLDSISMASRLEVSVRLSGTKYSNRWNIWVYPSDTELNWGDVKYTRDYKKASELLNKGHKVLFNPDWRTLKGIEGKFVPVFWSPVHFPNQAGTMGVLCDPAHPALSDFPTEKHSDWQWWDLNINSTTLVVDSLQGGRPVVEMIDNFVNNRRLASLFEGKVGEGRLMLATFDLEKSLDKRPVAKQMLLSILKYMNSSEFNPPVLEGLNRLEGVFGTVQNKKQSANGIY